MTGDAFTLQADYVPLVAAPDRHGRAAIRRRAAGAAAVRHAECVAMAIEESLPDAVGAFVDWLVNESGWTVTEREPGDEPVPSRGAARLHPVPPLHQLRRRRHACRTSSALEARGVPHVLVGGKTFHDREEVETLRAALAAIEWPDDELSVFATLRGPLFAIGDEELLEWKQRFRPFHPFRIRPERGSRRAPAADR